MLQELKQSKKETEEKIIAGTLDVLRTYGLQHGTIDMVATHLAMPKKMIHKNFNSKEKLVEAVITRHIDDTKRKLEAVVRTIYDAIGQMFVSGEILRKLAETINTKVVQQLKKYFPRSFKLLVSFNNEFLYNFLKENFTRGISQGVYKNRIDAEILSAYMVEHFVFKVTPGPFNSGVFREKEVERQMMLYHFFGVITEAGNRSFWTYNKQGTEPKANKLFW